MTAISRDRHIIIVGGGIIGVSAAFSIASRTQARVTVVEARSEVGLGATSKAVGGIRHQFLTPTNVRLTQLSLARYERFEEEMGQSIGLRLHGYLLVTANEETWRQLQLAVAMQQSLGVPSRLVTPAEAGALYPALRTDDLAGGAFCPIDGSGNPTDAVQGFRKQSLKLGVQFIVGERVERILTRDGGTVGVETALDRYDGDIVINAAGSAASELAHTAGVYLPAKPYRRQIFVGAPIPWLRRGLPMLFDLDTGWYMHQDGAGVLMLGGTDSTRRPGTKEEVDWEAFDDVAAAALRRVPPVAEVLEIQSAYCGIRTLTRDNHPILGAHPRLVGYVSATACNGHGFMHAPAVGDLLAETIIYGQPNSIPAGEFAIERFGSGSTAQEVSF